jgi:beta-galactosidase
MRKRLFNTDWEFKKESLKDSTETSWEKVDIPHDWLIYNTEDLYEDSIGYYRKEFELKEITEKKYKLYFEGVYMDSTVYVNDSLVGEWKYGYSSFEFDITDFLKLGKNKVVVKVVYKSPNSRWYSGAGIYRNVWLITTSYNHLITDGLYITTRKEKEGFCVDIDTEFNCVDNVYLYHKIYDDENNKIINSEYLISPKNNNLLRSLYIKSPNLWSIKNPYLYTVKTQLVLKDKVIDEIVQKFGFRTIEFDNNKGFFLNGEYVKLHGVCEHHDLGGLGAAVNKYAIKRKFDILKDMGVNSIRTSHNMPAGELMDLADEMGCLIVSEAFDIWELQKTDYDYGRFFKEWKEKDVASWIRRDRNHPSVIMWSIGNEIYDTHVSERGVEITKELSKLVRIHDPKENGLITIGSNYMTWENAQKCANEIQVVGYNYTENLYEEHHKKYPHWVIYGSETASTVQSRGVYHFPANTITLTHDDEQCSSLGNCVTGWGSKSTQRNIIDDRDAKFCLGQYIWTGFDYIGEPTPYHTKNSYFGQIDTAGFRKDSFYLYKAEWTDYKKSPMVHILPYWDFNKNQLIDIIVYSNAPKVELFFDDISYGEFEIDHINGQNLSGMWQIPYKEGRLKAVAYDEKGKIIATDEKASFGDAKKIVMKSDKKEIKADGEDLAFIEINTLDENNNYVENANNRVFIEVMKNGRLLALDNGDSTDFDNYKGNNKKLFNGKLLAIVGSIFESGEIVIRAYSPGLKSCEIKLSAIKSEINKGISAQNKIEGDVDDYKEAKIPVRKIELTNHGKNMLNKESDSTTVSAKIYPKNASYKDLNWIAVTPGGTETNIAKVESKDGVAKVIALGDGDFRLRCTCNNGKTNPEIVSELEFNVSDLGKATFNPYKFIFAINYSKSNNELRNGNLGGVVTKIDEMCYISYENVDFGDFGSNKIKIPIFYWDDDVLPIELWDGMPDEKDAKLIDVLKYKAEKEWNTYVPNDFTINERIKGLHTLTFGIKKKLHFQGFEFELLEKAYSKLSATDNDKIYGDTFEIKDESIENIGNNVILEYNEMDFKENGFSKLIICGKSQIPVNTIHVRFHDENKDINQIVEFESSNDYVEREFLIENVTGKQKVSLVFLPGSKFDLKWIKFIEKK